MRWVIVIVTAVALVAVGLVMVAMYRPLGARPLQTMTISGPVATVAINASGDTIVAGGITGSLTAWNHQAEPSARRLAGHQCTVVAAAFSPNNRYLITAGGGGALLRWNLAGDWAVQEFISNPSGSCSTRRSDIRSIAFRPDSTLVAVGTSRQVRLFNIETGATIHALDTNEAIETLAFSPDGHLLAGGGARTTTLWRIQSDIVELVSERSTEADQAIAFRGNEQIVLGRFAQIEVQSVIEDRRLASTHLDDISYRRILTFSPDGEIAALSGIPRMDIGAIFPFVEGVDSRLRFTPVSNLEEMITVQGHEDRVAAAAFSHDGTLLVSGSDNGTVRLWRVPDFDK